MACLNGQGRPLAVAVSFLCGAFLITPVSGYLLAFVAKCCGDTQLFGLWFGLICGYMVTTLISMVAVARSDQDMPMTCSCFSIQRSSTRSCRACNLSWHDTV